MSDHIAPSQMERFCARTLSVPELTTIAQHLASCESCHGLFSDTFVRQGHYAPAATFQLEPERCVEHEHLTYEQLSPYVENSTGRFDRYLVDLHLKTCDSCRADVHSFQEYRRRVELDSSVRHHVHSSLNKKEPWAVLSALRSLEWRSGVAGVTALAAFLLIATTALTIVLSGRRSAERQQAQLASPTLKNEAQVKPPSDRTGGESAGDQSTHTSSKTASQNEVQRIIGKREGRSDGARRDKYKSSDETTAHAQVQSGITTAKSIIVRDGVENISIDASGDLSGLADLPVKSRELVRTALTSRNITRPSVLSEIDRAAHHDLRGTQEGKQTFRLLAPQEAVLTGDRPTFRWEPLNRAASYQIYLTGSHGNEVITSPKLPPSLTEWTPAGPLKRGEIYNCAVVAVIGGEEFLAPAPPEPEMKFKILSEADTEELNDLLRRVPRSHLALGIFYARVGMIAEAERELLLLSDQNPKSNTVRVLLRTIRSWRHKP